MRVLYHHRTRGGDAQGVHIAALCRAFRALGHEVRLVGPSVAGGGGSGREGSTLFGRKVPSWVFEALALAYNLPAFLRLAWHLARQRPDLVYERYALFGIAGRLASAWFRIPFVLEVNAPLSLEMQAHGGLAFPRLARAVEDWLCRGATRTVVVSEAMRGIFAARGLPPERFLVIPNGVDSARFHTAVEGTGPRRVLGLDDLFVVGFVGWVRRWHGVDTLVEALGLLRDRVPDIALLVVGEGPAVPELRRRADALGMGERVVFSGAVPREEVPDHVAAMDVAVQPDVTDYASPIKLFEYLAMGKAVVAPDKPNIREVVADGQEALLVPPGSAAAMAEALARLHRDAALRRTLGARAARLVSERAYHWEGNARRVLEAVA